MKISHAFSFILTSVTAGLAAALVLLVLRPQIDLLPSPGNDSSAPRGSSDQAARLGHGPVSYAEAVARAAPSVVNIFTAKITTEQVNPIVQDPLLRRFLGKVFNGMYRQQIERSLGSGVIFSPEGYVLTNNHIIRDADEIKVVLADGRDVPVRIVGTDPETDLAVLRVEATNLPAIPIGDSDRLRVGDVVLAIGNPFGVGQTVTMGIVGATGRSHLGINPIENFIQTDAAINRGNSGGALINAHGELVGVNTAIYSPSGGSHGIGFAIPAALAKGVMKRIIQDGRVVRGWLGISAQDVTPQLVESFGLKDIGGVMVTSVQDDGPAEQAGIRPGDVITAINGLEPNNSQQLLTIIAAEPPGSNLRISGWRGSQPIDLHAVITERPPTTN